MQKTHIIFFPGILLYQKKVILLHPYLFLLTQLSMWPTAITCLQKDFILLGKLKNNIYLNPEYFMLMTPRTIVL